MGVRLLIKLEIYNWTEIDMSDCDIISTWDILRELDNYTLINGVDYISEYVGYMIIGEDIQLFWNNNSNLDTVVINLNTISKKNYKISVFETFRNLYEYFNQLLILGYEKDKIHAMSKLSDDWTNSWFLISSDNILHITNNKDSPLIDL